MSRNRREILKGIAREQWDPMHPGPLAFEIHPTHVDSDLVRFEIYNKTSKLIEAWIKLPTPTQMAKQCDRCPRRHSPANPECSGNKKRRKRPGRYHIVDLLTGEKLPGRWIVTSWEVKPGYKSGRAVLHRA